MISTPQTRILHLHIEKCGGTALRTAIARAIGPATRLFPKQYERDMEAIEADQWDLISGHCGWQVLQPYGGHLVTVLRDPVDRFVSSYFFWRDMYRSGKDRSHRAVLTDVYPLDEFVKIKDEQSLIQGLLNAMTWQLAYSPVLPKRQAQRARGITEAELIATAIAHLGECAVVGLQEHMGDFASHFEQRLGLKLDIERVNVTEGRPGGLELSAATRRRILEWVYLDMELYQAACALVAARTRQLEPAA
jgi:hypothetical protein